MCNNAAIGEVETAISCYNSICANSPGQPIWAVAENYRFEPAFVEVIVLGNFDLIFIILGYMTNIY